MTETSNITVTAGPVAASPPLLAFCLPGGENVGKIECKDGRITFSGDADAAAHVFIEHVVAQYDATLIDLRKQIAALSSRPAQEAVAEDIVDRIAIDMHYADGDPCTVKWAKQSGKYRASMRRNVRDVLASMDRLGIFRPAASATPSHGADTSAMDTAPNKPSDAILAMLPITAGQGVEVIVTDVLTKHCGQQGGSPRVNWYALRNELVAALKTAQSLINPTHTQGGDATVLLTEDAQPLPVQEGE